MRLLRHAFIILALLSCAPAWAVQPDEVLSDPALEARARTLSRELRCMVCQNQSIDDSDAPLARDLRILVRERLQAGDGDQQVIDFLVARYGEFVLLKPRLSWHTAVLWLGPAAVLLIGTVVLLIAAWRRGAPRGSQTPAGDAELTPAEAARLSEILRQSDR
jgi:cytochrome c-type biogenesis protein CcmH